MSWKKSGISYLVWVVYVLVSGIGLVCLAGAVCDFLKAPGWLGTAVCGSYIALAGLAVYLIHRRRPANTGMPDRERIVRAVVEAAVTVIILAVGLILRIEGMDGAGERAAYYETASVTSGQGIPQIVQGAVYLYVRLLHILFYFLGNKFMMGVWLQIFMQFAAVLLLYLAVRYCVGKIAAMVFLGFCMFSPYMIQEALTLSPEMLYLLLWSAALLWIVTRGGGRLKPFEFLAAGAVAAFLLYLDAAGFFLFLFAGAAVFCRREENPGGGKKALAALMCLLGGFLGCVGCVAADAGLSGKTFAGVLTAWLMLYEPESFSVPVVFEAVSFPADCIIMVCMLVFGIFSFWRDKRNDRISVWVLGVALAAAGGCLGIFTPYMPVGIYLYLMLVILAGVGAEECFRRPEPAEIPTARPERPAAVTADRRVGAGSVEAAKDSGSMEGAEGGECLSEEPEFLNLDSAPESHRKPVKLIENPLPLPKRHKRRSLDYSIREFDERQEDFDLQVDENDDFDI